MKMNRQKEMEKILNYLYKIAIELGNDFNMDTVYHHLTRGIIDKNKRQRIDDLFPIFINYFLNKRNIRVFNSPRWKYFCQFINNSRLDRHELFNPIKMYLSVDRENIQNFAIKLFDFMEKNNIIHESKIGSEVRSDDIVIRVFSKESEKQIREFIKNDKEIRNSLMKQIPFCFSQDGIGYAIDGDLSYNCTVSKYICEYIKDCIKNNKKVSLNDFYDYVNNIYQKSFVDKTEILRFKTKFAADDNIDRYSEASVLNNYEEITKLLLLAIKENDFNYYLDMVDSLNNLEKVNENKTKFVNKEHRKIELERKNAILRKAILETYKKYDIEQVMFAMKKAYNGDYSAFTDSNSARSFLINNVSPSEFREILNLYANGDIKKYVDSCLGLNEKIADEVKETNNDLTLKAIYLNKAIMTTYEKYGFKQTLTALNEVIYNNDFGYFTNDCDAREILKNNVTTEDIKIIIQNNTNGDISEYINMLIKSLGLDYNGNIKK